MLSVNPFIEKLLENLGTSNKFDCLEMFSGGKDSTYLIYLLKNVYKKRVLAFTVNTGIERESAIENIKDVIQKLDVPHVFLILKLINLDYYMNH